MANRWWESGVIYQVYPRSFGDADGDGVGDLKGISGHLGYLEWLGADAVWLSPIFPSPMADFGYDVSDYTDVHPLFGTLEDFDGLVEEAHRRGLKVILDFVPNHSSDEHPWFVESRSSRENPKRDWYVWRDPKPGGTPDGAPPNNWESYFGGPAWAFDEGTGQYYLRLFDRKQPDLNWRNPEVRRAMYDAMRFWFARGVDGFRIDVIWLLIKDELFRDNPPNPDWREGDPPWERQSRLYSEDRPEAQEIVREMRAVADEGGAEGEAGDRLLIGEIYLPNERLMVYYGAGLDGVLDGVHLPFNFALVTMRGWDAATVRSLVDAYEAALPEGAWPNWVLGNHDRPRVASRLGDAQARVAQTLLLSLRGTPTLYYGDEIGMRDVPVPEHLAADPQARNDPAYGRDPERTPMQWSPAPNAGFGPPDAEPWLPVAEDYEEVNVEAQKQDPRSMLALSRRLVQLRRERPALTAGSYRPLDAGADTVFAYAREHAGNKVLVALNFGAEPRTVDLSAEGASGEYLVSTHMDRSGGVGLGRLELRGDEGVVVAGRGG